MTAVVAAWVFASTALVQGPGGWVISVDYGPGEFAVHRNNPTCRVRISATHHPGDFAVAGVRFDLVAGEAGWVAPLTPGNLPPMNTGANPGTIDQGVVRNIVGGQLNFPPILIADPRSPIGVWEAVWSTTVFSRRQVPVSTRTIRFDAYASVNSPTSTSRLDGLVEGSGRILVAPAPGAAALLAPAWIGLRRRNRAPAAR